MGFLPKIHHLNVIDNETTSDESKFWDIVQSNLSKSVKGMKDKEEKTEKPSERF